MKDPYTVLGVDRAATAAEIKTAFRKISKNLHPDVGGEVEAFREAQEAYEILSDPAKRARYDSDGIVEDVGAKAIEVLVEMFRELLNQNDLSQVDIKGVAEQFLRTKTKEVTDELREMDVRISRMARLDKRMRLKQGANGKNAFLIALAIKEAALQREQLLLRTVLATFKMASELLGDYEHDFAHIIMISSNSKPRGRTRRFVVGDEQDFFSRV